MIKSIRGLSIAVLTAAMCGCIGSSNPVIPESARTFDPRLVGTWSDSALTKRAVITQTGPLSYGIQYTENQDQPLSLTGLLGRSRRGFILDVQATKAALGPYDDLVVRLHLAMVLDTIGPRIRVAILEPDSLDKYLRTNPGAIAHGRMTDNVMLTADTPELWQFLATYLQRPSALAAPTLWIRRSP